ncbi:MAG: hypothetical protein NWE77_07300 [Candidatus Bathyarchaeota archaeon]|nr:hypothetical protein [Candidatus Bathyarchaeota archaeon]
MSETEREKTEPEKDKRRRPKLSWSIICASGLNYAGVTSLMVFWHIDLVNYILSMLGVSILIGVLLIDFEKTIIHSISGLVIGNALPAAIFLAPYNMFGESLGAVNAATLVVLSLIGKHLLISIAPFLVGTIFGCLIGQRLDDTQL